MKSGGDFDLIDLLSIEELDIHRIASDSPFYTVGEYFNAVYLLVENKWSIARILDTLITHPARDWDLLALEEKKDLFAACGAFTMHKTFQDIISCCKRGHFQFAADHAKNLSSDFTSLMEKIAKAQKPEQHDAENAERPVFLESQVLYKVIKLYEHKESIRKLRVLAVDDSGAIIKTITSILEKDYKVYGLTDPLLVERFLTQIIPELFLLDCQMPGMNGFELVPVIRNIPEHKDTPIIFVTSLGTVDNVAIAYSYGACDFIVKPFTDSVLLEKVAKHIVKKT